MSKVTRKDMFVIPPIGRSAAIYVGEQQSFLNVLSGPNTLSTMGRDCYIIRPSNELDVIEMEVETQPSDRGRVVIRTIDSGYGIQHTQKIPNLKAKWTETTEPSGLEPRR